MRRRRKKEEEHKRITDILNERLEVHDESKEKVPKTDFNKACGGLRAQTNECEEKGQQGGSRGRGKDMTEDNRLQKKSSAGFARDDSRDVSKNDSKKRRRSFFVTQPYEVTERGLDDTK